MAANVNVGLGFFFHDANLGFFGFKNVVLAKLGYLKQIWDCMNNTGELLCDC